jgi:hypothetical protein
MKSVPRDSNIGGRGRDGYLFRFLSSAEMIAITFDKYPMRKKTGTMNRKDIMDGGLFNS